MAVHRLCTLLPFVVVVLLSSCSFTEPELVEIREVSLSKFSKEAVELSIKAKVSNPNNYDVSLVSSKLDIFINDEPMGKALLKDQVRFIRKSTNYYDIQLVNEPENFAKLGVVSFFAMMGKKKLKITLRGKVRGRIGVMCKNFDVNLTEYIVL